MAYIQGTQSNRAIYLTLADVPATTVAYTDVTIQYVKSGQTSYVPKTLTSAQWIVLGNGVYKIVFTATEMDTLGDFLYTITGAKFDNIVYDEFTIEPAPAGSQTVLPNQCIVSGTVFNQSALPPQSVKIVARPAQFPAKDGNNILTADAVWTYADAYGNFSLPLIQNSVALIYIERAGIRGAQITVPASPSANMIDLLPPIVIDYSI